MKINDVDLLSLQSGYMRSDPTTQGLCAGIEPQIHSLADEVMLLHLYARINPKEGSNLESLPEWLLDELAWSFHVDYYDVGDSVSKKRSIVASAIRIHRLKGTPAAVEEAISIAFDTATLEEWFEYAGNPYEFRITTDAALPDLDTLDKFLKALSSAKNVRSHLTDIVINRTAELSPGLHIGLVKLPEYNLLVESPAMTWSDYDTYDKTFNDWDVLDLTWEDWTLL